MIERRRCPGVGAVAVFTGRATRYMVGRFTLGRGSVMAAETGTGNVDMIKLCTAPVAGRVTIIAAVTAAHV